MRRGCGACSPWVLVLSAALWAGGNGLAVSADAQNAQDEEAGESSTVKLSVETPREGQEIGDQGGMAFIAGRALAQEGNAQVFDVMFVLDQSESTSAPSGADINGDGEVDDRACSGVPSGFGVLGAMMGQCGTSKDSVLGAELLAVRTLLQQLDPRSTRVGVVAFSGDGKTKTADAFIRSRLSADYPRVERSLEKIQTLGPKGRTNMEAGVKVAAGELIESESVFSSLGQRAQKIMLFLSDGVPTLPVDGRIRQNRQLAVEAAVNAARADIRLDTYGIGQEAVSEPVALVEMARVTSGLYTPVREPRDLQSIFEQINFSDVDEVRVTNRTNNTKASYVGRGADGTFSALLEMVDGSNLIEVYARANDGSEQTRQLTVRFRKDANAPALPLALLAQKNRLLANRLKDLKERGVALPAKSDDEIRKELQIRIQQERAKAEARAREVRIEEGQPEDAGKKPEEKKP